MSEYAPQALFLLFHEIDKALGGVAELSGILGDRSHTYGYHRARNVLPSSDYSVEATLDRKGDGWAASALDIKLPPHMMRVCTQRLLDAKHDRRLAAVREFFGTIDGQHVVGWDLLQNRSDTSDDSHLWHIHLSIYRAFANDPTALAPIVDVLAGVEPPKSAKPPTKPKPPAQPSPSSGAHALVWPLPRGHYFGLVSGPPQSHGGFYASERPYVKAIQRRLQTLGYATKSASWADGTYGEPTRSAVARWQRATARKLTTRYGEVWADDWRRLFP